MFPISDLIPTHNRLRSMESLSYFISLFHDVGSDIVDKDIDYGWTCSKGKVVIIKTEDGRHYLWDAHHRVCAAYNEGHLYIPDGFYTINEMTYKKVMSINFDKGYVTPFNLKTECRLPDFIGFKTSILEQLKPSCKLDCPKTYYTSLELDILLNAKSYKEPRSAYTVEDLLNATRLLKA